MLGEIVKQLKETLTTKQDVDRMKKELEMKIQNVFDSLLNFLQKQTEKINEIVKNFQELKTGQNEDIRYIIQRLDSIASIVAVILIFNIILFIFQLIILAVITKK